MEITQEDAHMLAGLCVGKRPKLSLRGARFLRSKLDILIQQLSSADESLKSWINCMIVQPEWPSGDDIMERRRMWRDKVAEEATCEHSCAYHGAVMNPRIWGNLPKELWPRIFARLPLYEIFRLSCLFKEWNQSIFKRVAAEAHGKMFARISSRTGSSDHELALHLFDIKSNRWHKLRLSTPEPCQAMSSDGGLVCIVSRNASGPARIMVCNPLTRAWRELPGHEFSMIQPCMAQLVMNRDTKCYKVLVVAPEDDVEYAVMFDSATGLWSSADSFSDVMYGCWYFWTESDEELIAGIESPCVYDCTRGKLVFLNVPEVTISYALVKNRLFILQNGVVQNTRGDFWSRVIMEHESSRAENPTWLQLKVHECSHFTDHFRQIIERSNYEMHLLACEGLLLVATDNELVGPLRQELLWIYDLDTCKWHETVAPPERFFIEFDTGMCELQWDAIP